MKIDIEIIDLGINNLKSVVRSISEVVPASQVRVINSPTESNKPAVMVLPGVGNFGTAMESFERREMLSTVLKHVDSGGWLLGICLGMQLLGNSSQESPGIRGLGVIAGESLKLQAVLGEKVPNVGWATTVRNSNSNTNLEFGRDYYFTHSYHFKPINPHESLASINFGGEKITAAVKSNNVIGFQFHPEKSGRAGQDLLKKVFGEFNEI
jgi:glutamine amidotransferase